MTVELLRQRHLSIITREADAELGRIQSAIGHKVLVDGRAELEAELGRMLGLGVAPTPKTLDLIGHTTSDRSLLVLGDWVLDGTSSTVVSFFRGLADQDVLARLGIETVRLLGCMTADSAYGRWTLCKLAEVLGVEVLGTTGLMFASHYRHDGLAEEHRHLLVSASELRANTPDPHPLAPDQHHERALDVDSLPASLLPRRPWSVRIVEGDDARAVLRLVRRRDGSLMPGLLAEPGCELAFPSSEPGRYYLAQVLLDGEIVRVYPEGEGYAGVCYPVDDPHELKRVIDQLPRAGITGR